MFSSKSLVGVPLLVACILCAFPSHVDATCVNGTIAASGPQILCLPPYNVSGSTSNNMTNAHLYDSLSSISRAVSIDDPEYFIPYDCGMAYIRLFCNDGYPKCPGGNTDLPFAQIRACSSLCKTVVDLCMPYLSNFTKGKQQAGSSFFYMIPQSYSECDTTYSRDITCSKDNSVAPDTNYFYDVVPSNSTSTTKAPTPSTPHPTKKPTSKPSGNTDDVNRYPGGAAKGGFLGAGLLVAIMGLVGLMGIFMKRQERR